MKNWTRALLTAAVVAAATLPGLGLASAAEPAPTETFCLYDEDTNDSVCFDTLEDLRSHRPDSWHLATVYDTYYAGGARSHLFGTRPCTSGTGGPHAGVRALGPMNNRTSSIRMWGTCSRMMLFDGTDYTGSRSGWVPDTDQLSSYWNNKASSVWVT